MKKRSQKLHIKILIRIHIWLGNKIFKHTKPQEGNKYFAEGSANMSYVGNQNGGENWFFRVGYHEFVLMQSSMLNLYNILTQWEESYEKSI